MILDVAMMWYHVFKLHFVDAGGGVFEAVQETGGREGGGIWRITEYRKLVKIAAT
ncbi:MAG: hypothetical protein MJE68_32625 [Proteobacteria bacterium]|nr:hypothetical protein [Pseudomonadota bacterium]